MKIRIPGQDEKPTFLFVPNPTILTEMNVRPNINAAVVMIVDKIATAENDRYMLYVSKYAKELLDRDRETYRLPIYNVDEDLPDHEFYIFNCVDRRVDVLYTIRIAGDDTP